MKKQEIWIEHALKAMKENTKMVKDNTVQSEYRGYISSMGAGIIMNGVLPTLSMFMNASGAQQDKNELLVTIYSTIKKYKTQRSHAVPKEENLFDYALNAKDKQSIKDEIFQAAIAIKFAMRTFKIV